MDIGEFRIGDDVVFTFSTGISESGIPLPSESVLIATESGDTIIGTATIEEV